MQLTVKKSNVNVNVKFKSDSYDSTGLYLNNDGACSEFIFVSTQSNFVIFICDESQYVDLVDACGTLPKPEAKQEPKPEPKEGQISESFALKMLAIAQGQNINPVNINEL